MDTRRIGVLVEPVMVRATSIETYRAICAEGLLTRMRLRVYKALFHHGPLTGRELDQRLAGDDEKRTSYHKRLPELERMRCIETVGKRPCVITGRTALEWDVNGNLPTDYERPKRPTAKQFRNAAAELRQLYAFLRECESCDCKDCTCKKEYPDFSDNLRQVGKWMVSQDD